MNLILNGSNQKSRLFFLVKLFRSNKFANFEISVNVIFNLDSYWFRISFPVWAYFFSCHCSISSPFNLMLSRNVIRLVWILFNDLSIIGLLYSTVVYIFAHICRTVINELTVADWMLYGIIEYTMCSWWHSPVT